MPSPAGLSGTAAFTPPPDYRYERFLEDLAALNPDRLTPAEALNRIYAWKQLWSMKAAPPRPPRGPRPAPGPSLFDEG
jgi:hypothetical protein